MHDFIHTDWYQGLFSEPAPYRWLWRLANTWIDDEELLTIPPEKVEHFIASRLFCTINEVAYRKRRSIMRGKVKYTASYHRNKKGTRTLLLERDGDRCTICHRKLYNDLSIDHIDNTLLPDGSLNNDISNMRLSHALCNSRRGVHQNRKQNRSWKKATHKIAELHGADALTIGHADRRNGRRGR